MLSPGEKAGGAGESAQADRIRWRQDKCRERVTAMAAML
jgi:hypothetical protein